MSEPSLPSFETEAPRPRRTRKRKSANPSADASRLASPETISGRAEAASLLADPETIAGKRPARKSRHTKRPGKPADPPSPLAASQTGTPPEPRQPSGFESEAIETLRRKWGHDARTESRNTVDPLESQEGSDARGHLLDAAAARRLAAEAREREQASRKALELARRELARPSSRVEDETTRTPAEREVGPGGWQQQAMEPRRVESAGLARTLQDPAADRPASKLSEPTQSSEASRSFATGATGATGATIAAADLELQELRDTLEIARDTANQQKRELAELRARVERGEQDRSELVARLDETRREGELALAESQRELRVALDAAQHEVDRLRVRARAQTREMEAQDEERIRLEKALEERDVRLAAREEQLEDLRERFEAQDRALDAARSEYERERARHSENLERLAEVRTTLSGIAAQAGFDTSSAASTKDRSLERETTSDTHARAMPESAPSSPRGDSDEATSMRAPSSPAQDTANATSLVPEASQTAAPPTEPLPDEIDGPSALPAVFDAWQDDHIRRAFGPMGIDTFHDLLFTPLTRRATRSVGEQAIVLIGRGAEPAAQRLAESLLARGSGAFRIHAADPLGPLPAQDQRGLAMRDDSPLIEFLATFDFPNDPQALSEQLETIAPSVIVSRDFLSRQDNVVPWLTCFEEHVARGGSLVLSEGTGVDLEEPPREMARIGERIWELMPERYTQVGDGNEQLEHWSDAFAASETRCPNRLMAEMRERFRPEMLTQFGFLAEPFLSSSIGANFDPEAPRDRRFLRQVADLDDRKIEAGLAPALHLAALIDPLAED